MTPTGSLLRSRILVSVSRRKTWGVGYQIFNFLVEIFNKKSSIEIKHSKTFFWSVFGLSWVGSKVFYLISSAKGEYEVYMNSSNFWFGGGFVFYGGLVFGLIFISIYSIWLRKFPREYLFLAIPALSISHGLGRIGCLLAGCCFGIKSELPWAIYLHGHYRHPVQIYEAILLLVLGYFLLSKIIKRVKIINFDLNALSIYTIFMYFTIYSIARYFLEGLRGDLVRGVSKSGFSTSQIISLVLILGSGVFLYKNIKILKKMFLNYDS